MKMILLQEPLTSSLAAFAMIFHHPLFTFAAVPSSRSAASAADRLMRNSNMTLAPKRRWMDLLAQSKHGHKRTASLGHVHFVLHGRASSDLIFTKTSTTRVTMRLHPPSPPPFSLSPLVCSQSQRQKTRLSSCSRSTCHRTSSGHSSAGSERDDLSLLSTTRKKCNHW